MPRITEDEVAVVVLHILAAQPNGTATVKAIKEAVPQYIRLSSADHADSETRAGEELWEQQVRNLKSHHDVPGNIFHDGLVVSVSRGVWRITPYGQSRIAKAA